MAEKRLIQDEYAQIMEHIQKTENFLLSGGAGSGKTYTLVQVIRGLLKEYPIASIACITYTNAAVLEIKHRVDNNRLHVSTIHDFLWDCIKNFQDELKKSIPEIINSNDYKMSLRNIDECPADYFYSNEINKIEYSEHLNLSKGIISHDEVLELSHYMFSHYPKLCEIVKSRYPYILIDEYQDTSKLVVEIVLKYLSPAEKVKDSRLCVVGFFGDVMQSIYDDGIGNLDVYKTNNGGHVHEIKKIQNRRNPQSIINLANKIRIDGLEQSPSNDIKAPNMDGDQVKKGKITFLYSDTDVEYMTVRKYITETYRWDFSDVINTKELNLTHNMIAGKLGFPNLMEIFNGDKVLDYCSKIRKEVDKHPEVTDYDSMTLGEVLIFLSEKYGEDIIAPTKGMKEYIDLHPELFDIAKNTPYNKITKIYVEQDQLIDDKKQDEENSSVGSKRARVIKHLFKIQEIIFLYKQNRMGDFLKATGKKSLSSFEEKRILADKMNQLCITDNITLGNFIDKANELEIYPIDDKLRNYIEKYEYVYNRIRSVSYKEFLNYYNYMEGKTPFSTQHKTKGSEYENVLVLLESKWNKYNFGYMMGNKPARKSNSYDSVVNRTLKLFYVCCTRAKNHLIVFYSCPEPTVLDRAKEWFGNENVYKLPIDALLKGKSET